MPSDIGRSTEANFTSSKFEVKGGHHGRTETWLPSEDVGSSMTPAVGGPTPNRTHHGGRKSQRTQILEAALELFSQGGSRGTPLAAIPKKVGVTVPAIVHHFGSRSGLLVEVVALTDGIDEIRMSVSSGFHALERIGAIRSWAQQLVSDRALANLSQLTLVMTCEAFDADFPAHEHFVASAIGDSARPCQISWSWARTTVRFDVVSIPKWSP